MSKASINELLIYSYCQNLNNFHLESFNKSQLNLQNPAVNNIFKWQLYCQNFDQNIFNSTNIFATHDNYIIFNQHVSNFTTIATYTFSIILLFYTFFIIVIKKHQCDELIRTHLVNIFLSASLIYYSFFHNQKIILQANFFIISLEIFILIFLLVLKIKTVQLL